jgi:hypothetical protein
LDKAVLRRFPIKIHFDYLIGEQREKCFTRSLSTLGYKTEEVLPEHMQDALSAINNLTPGDFSLLTERWRLLSTSPDPEQFFRELDEESRLKPESRRSAIGFASSRPRS